MTGGPSRQFIKRGSIAIGIIAVILIVQSAWFRKLFHKNPPSVVVHNTTTVGDIVTKDTNGNGIADWEERLWGLDPAVLYTNGVSNKQIIEEKKKSLGATDADATPSNETDALARQLFIITSALGQNETIDDAALESAAAKLGATLNLGQVSNRYSAKDIQTVQTTTASLEAYYTTMSKKAATYQTNSADIDVVISALETGDTTRVPELLTTAAEYRKIARDLVAVPVPVGVSSYHLGIVNGFAGVADSFTYLQELDDNATNALVGIAIYQKYNKDLSTALINMRDYLTRYGIL